MTDEISVEYVDFEEVEQWPRNPKDHDLHEIRKSFYRFGFIKPVLVDEGTGKLVAGHGRLDTLRLLKDRNVPPPRGVQVVEDKWRALIWRVKGNFRELLEVIVFKFVIQRIRDHRMEDFSIADDLHLFKVSGASRKACNMSVDGKPRFCCC